MAIVQAPDPAGRIAVAWDEKLDSDFHTTKFAMAFFISSLRFIRLSKKRILVLYRQVCTGTVFRTETWILPLSACRLLVRCPLRIVDIHKRTYGSDEKSQSEP